MNKRIWYTAPAPTGEEKGREWFGGGWNEALPIGNGSIGAMVYGDPVHDTLRIYRQLFKSARASLLITPASATG